MKNDPGELPPVLDVERHDNYSKAALSQRVKMCLDEIERLFGRKPIIYTAKYFWQDRVGPVTWASEYDLWVANYFVTKPNLPSDWSTWTFHQDRDNWNVPGMADPTIDRDWFNGSEAELMAYAGVGLTLEEKVELLWGAHPELHP